MCVQQIEVHTDYPYVNIRKAIFEDVRIRPQTKYVLILMLSLPPDWDYSIRGMAKIAHISKDTMAKMVKELESAGYLRRKPQGRQGSGRFGRGEYILTDMPSEDGAGQEPCPNLPDTVPPYTENSPQVINKQVINKQEFPPIVPPEGDKPTRAVKRSGPKTAPDWKPERFEGFWRLYPLKKSKQAAIRAWDRLRPDDHLIAVMGRTLVRQMASDEWQRGFGIPYPATWLNGRRWEDEDQGEPAGGEVSPGIRWGAD